MHDSSAVSGARSPSEAQATDKRAPASAWYGLAVLIAATLLSLIDRQVLLLTAEPLRKSLGLSDTDLGLLQGVGIVLFAGLAALPVAWAADRYGRRIVLVASVLTWCAAVVACGASRNFTELFVASAFLGIGQAGLGPIVFGLIPDLFPPRQRILANAIYGLVATLGGAVGLFVGGSLVSSVDSLRTLLPAGMQSVEAWRLAFFVVASPGPIMALLIVAMRLRRTTVNTKPAHADAAAPSRIKAVEYIRSQLRTVLGLFGSIGLLGFGFGAIGVWVPIIAARTFGATPTEVGQGLGAAIGIGTVIGAVLVVPAARLMGSRVGIATPLRVIEFGLVIAVALCALLPFVTSSAQMFAIIGVQVAAITIGSMLSATAMQDISPPYLRSQVLAIGSIVTLAVTTTSPVVVGALSDALQASPRALLIAVTVVAAAGLGFGGLLLRFSERAFVRTVTTFNPEPSVGPP